MALETAEPPAAPTAEEVRRIAAMSDPVLRNLAITHCYGRLTAQLHAPFDAFERTSDAVARGNRRCSRR